MCTHGIFCIPKDGGAGRSIVDCSKPNELSVNNFTEEVPEIFSYNSVDSVISIMERYDFLTICMGLSSSPYTFSKVPDFLTRCAARQWNLWIINYLDDFCILGKTSEEATLLQNTFINIGQTRI